MGRGSTRARFRPRVVQRFSSMVQSPDTGPGNDTLGELHRIWESATADTISGDLDRAADLAERVPDMQRAEAARYMAALWRLERWLHDR